MKRVLTLAAGIVLALSGSVVPATANAASQQVFWTFYGWYDNTPPGGDVAYPQIHDTAGGKGTWSDPITFATSSKEATAPTAARSCGTSTRGSAAGAATP
jgi:hypothetical protein